MTYNFRKPLCMVVIAILLCTFQASNCSAGIVYATNLFDGTISRIDETGAVSTFATGLSGPSQIVVDGTGTLFVSSVDDGTIRRYSASGTDLGIFATLTDADGNVLGASGMALDATGNLYVGSSVFSGVIPSGDIRKFSANSDDLGVFAHFEHQGPNFFGPASYFSMAFDHSGNLWAIDDFFASAYNFLPDGTLDFVSVGQDGSELFAIAVSPDGNIFTADTLGNFRQYEEDGTFRGFQIAGDPYISALTFDSDGTMLYAKLPGEIYRVAQDGTDLGLFASNLFAPYGLAFAPSAAVPEPSSLALCGVVAIALTTRRRRTPHSH